MEFSGTVIEITDSIERERRSGSGTFETRKVVVRNSDLRKPEVAVFDFYGDRTRALEFIRPGDEVIVKFDFEARHWNKNWYNTLAAWRIDLKK